MERESEGAGGRREKNLLAEQHMPNMRLSLAGTQVGACRLVRNEHLISLLRCSVAPEHTSAITESASFRLSVNDPADESLLCE